MEWGNFDLVGTEVKNYQTRPDGLLVPRGTRIRSFTVWIDGDRCHSTGLLLPGRAKRGDGTGKFRHSWDGSDVLKDQTGWFACAEKGLGTKVQELNRRGSASTIQVADALKSGAGRWNWGFSTLLIGTKTITRPDRMVCSCREEAGYEVSGPESTGIGFHESDR